MNSKYSIRGDHMFANQKESDVFLLLKIDSEGTATEIVEVGDRLCDLLGYRREELLLLSPSNIVYGCDKHEFTSNGVKTFQFVTSTNGKITLQLEWLTLADSQTDLVVLYEKNSDKKQDQNHHLETLDAYYRSLFDHNPEAIFKIDPSGKFIRHNRVTEQLFAANDEMLKTLTIAHFIQKDQVEKVDELMKKVFSVGKAASFNTEIISTIGQEIPVLVKIIPIMINGDVIGAHGIVRDITKEKRTEKKMKQIAFYDDVTLLPNKRSFLNEVEKRCNQDDHNKKQFAIIKLCINRVTHMKDLFGQELIDKLMKTLAEKMSQSLNRDCFVSRNEEDKFGIILNIHNKEDLFFQSEEIYTCIPDKLIIDNQEIKVDFHSGMAIYPNDGENAEELIKNCKYALLIADEENVSFLQYDPQKSGRIKRKIEIEKELYRALKENQFELYYQPQYDVVKCKIIGAEALVRWFHPQLGMISPAEFIPIAETNGLIIDIGKWVIEEGCKQLKIWRDQGYEEIKLSLNLSVRQLYQNNIVEMIDHTLKQYNLTPDSLAFEFTESSMMHDIDHFIQVISKFKSLGFHISIDDFGTGYSSLYYLTRLQIDSIKIDRSFIQHMEYSKENEMVITSIISMAKNLQLQIIAEGVETYNQLAMLKKMNCELIQGYYISKPIPADEFWSKGTGPSSQLSFS